MLENSGFAFSPPIRIRPTGMTMSARQKITNTLPATMNSQLKLPIDQPLAPSNASLADSGTIRVPTTNSRISTLAIQNTGWCTSIPYFCRLS
jgi:hypothetical protein